MAYTVLIFDNRPDNVQTLATVIRNKFGYRTIISDSSEYGIGWLVSARQPQPDLILIDLANSGAEILQIIRKVKACKPQLPVIVMMQYGNDDYAVPAIAAGANDFLTKPVGVERLKLSMQNVLKIQNLNNAVARLERKNTGYIGFSDLIGQSEAFKKALNMAEKAANFSLPVWIDGEHGTGRESLARAIHGSSRRAGKPFIAFNCASANHDNVEATLFGKSETANQLEGKSGMLQAANQGTIYFDEITALPSALQQRLLEVISNRELNPTGYYSPIALDIRIMCSNSKDKRDAMLNGVLNNALHEKLCIMPINLPSLFNRKSDIAALAQHFLNVYAASENRSPAMLSDDAIQSLENHPWPGNIRQLANLLHRAALLSQADHVDAATLRLVQQLEPVDYTANKATPPDAVMLFDRKGQVKKLRSIENEAIQLALKFSGGCMTKAARNLGIGRSTLYRKIDEMGAGTYIPRENQTTRPIMPASAGELS